MASNCEVCGSERSAVLKQWVNKTSGTVSRRRQCDRCSIRWTTWEMRALAATPHTHRELVRQVAHEGEHFQKLKAHMRSLRSS